MADKVFPQSQLPVRKTHELLPSIFQTESNKKFMAAAVDPLVQPGSLQKLSGYAGKRYGKTYNGSDVYIDSDNTLRSRYQIEPAVNVKNHGSIEEFYDYLDFKNQLKFFGNDNDQDNLITSQKNYSWNPPINWDKFINYREYYWEPLGPPPVDVLGQAPTVVSTYKVKLGIGPSYILTPDGLTDNPSITLYRGQTYKFVVNVPKDGFTIRRNYDTGSLTFDPNKTYFPGELAVYDGKLFRAKVEVSPVDGSSIDLESQDWEFLEEASDNSPTLIYNKGVTNNGIEKGTITFEVPLDAPSILYYQSKVDPNRLGRFVIGDIEENTSIDVEKEILGKTSYTSSNGIVFTNNLVVQFLGNVVPEKYSKDTWIIEGVGNEITLTRFNDLVVPVLTTDVPEVLFDNEGFDSQPFDDASAYPSQKDYITISRDSKDNNPWSRYNRWFHRSVLTTAYNYRGQDFQGSETSRAKRPIIEFKPNLQLYNHGTIAKQTVDYLDNFTDDIFSKIEGSTSYNIDGEFLFQGARILVTADTDSLVNNKIYVVNFITHNNREQIHLVESDDSDSVAGSGILISRGSLNGGTMYHFDGSTWLLSQAKTRVNQAPMFDSFDENGISYSNEETYPVTDFVGTKLFSYKVGNGIVDKELGFSLSYLNIDNIGDIQFNWDWESQKFTYTLDRTVMSKKISTGFYHINGTSENGWIQTSAEYLQPIYDSVVIKDDLTQQVIFNTVDWNLFDSDENSKIIFFLNGKKITETYQRTGKTFTFNKSFKLNDVVSLKLVTNSDPVEGYYEIPVCLEKNPLNNNLSSFTFGQALDHVSSGLEFNDSFEGIIPGDSNLKDISGYEGYGKRFLKHEGIAPISLYLLCTKNLNIIKSLQYSKRSYNEFKNNFINKSIEIDFNNNIIDFVDDIISEITKTKTNESPFADSDMIGTGAFTSIVYDVTDEGIKTFSLNQSFNLSTPSRRAVYVYLNGQQLINSNDYVFNDTFGFVTISKNINLGDRIEIREYVSTASCHIPPTPTKMGLYKKYTPMKFIDNTYREPREVIQGHDGSITLAYGDFRDDLLLELELRIYNNIKEQYDESIFDIDAIIGGYYGNSLFNKKQLDDIVNYEFFQWVQNTNINYTLNNYFVENETFTYTYSNMTDPTRTRSLPGYWRGVYKWFYDTDRPHTCPWEMLGFSEKPAWWEDEYGAAPYTRGNLILWEDIRDGIIRQGPRAGQYDRYKRDSILNHIPVDLDGNLLSPLDSGLANDFTLINNKGPFKLGDISPVEYAWRSSSDWPFAVTIAMSLLKPFEFISSNLERSLIKKNIIGQTVSSKSNEFVNISDFAAIDFENDLITGLLKYLISYSKSLGISSTQLQEKITNLDVNLSHRLNGFANKNQFNYLLDSKNPKSASNNIFIPPENYDIIFNVSSSISDVTYSGVILEKTEGGWVVNGYDSQNPYFSYYDVVPNQKDPALAVGGVSENFVDWESNKSFVNGQVARYRGDFYRALKTHTSTDNFESTDWKKLAKLPVINGVEALKRRNFNKLYVRKLPYGSKLTSIQQVVDLLLGYEEYLKSIGIVFDGYDTENQTALDWTMSAKEFMFWTRHNWELGSLITLSPSANSLKIVSPLGVAENFLDGFYDYQIYKGDGKPLIPAFLNVNRDFQSITIETTNTTEGIYFLKAFYVLKENIAVFSDRTVFNDVMYDKTSGYRQERIKIQGFRTVDWDGDYTSPGFLFDNVNIQAWQSFVDYKLGDIVSYRGFYWTSQINQIGTDTFDERYWTKLDSRPEKQLISNFDYKINQFEDFFDPQSEGLGENEKTLAQHTIGYQTREYLQNMAQDPVTQFNLYQGFIREKGTRSAIEKVFGKLSRNQGPGVSLKEEWAIRVGQLGGIDQLSEVELEFKKDNFNLNPQPVISVDYKPSVAIDEYYRIDKTDFTIHPENFSTTFIPTSFDAEGKRTAGYVRLQDVEHIVAEYDDIVDLDIDSVSENDHIWVTFYNDTWNVFRLNTLSTIYITDIIKSGTSVTVTFNRRHNIQENEIVGFRNIENLTGFFKVTSIGTFSITVSVSESAQDPAPELSTNVPVLVLTEARFSSFGIMDLEESALLKNNSRLWVDNDGTGKWEVIKKQKLYNDIRLEEYGITEPLSTGHAVVYDDIRKNIITSILRSGYVVVYRKTGESLTVKQILEPPTELSSSVTNSFGTSLEISPDGRWLAIGCSTASGIPSRLRGDYDPQETYQADDVVLYSGQLYKATKDVVGDGSSINVYTEDWTPVDMLLAETSGSNIGYREQGVVFLYEFADQQWNLRLSIVSPRQALDEKFGHSISIGVNGSQYYMAISAPGSLDSRGRVYLYKYDTAWKHAKNNRYKGVYDPGSIISSQNLVLGREYRIEFVGDTDFTAVGADSNTYNTYFIATGPAPGTGLAESYTVYYAGDIVWYGNDLWECLADSTSQDGSTITVESEAWKKIDDISTHVSLPTNIALDDDGSTLAIGLLSEMQLAEIIKQGDGFGHSLAMSRSGDLLVVGAPEADGQYFANYRGIWRPDIEYIEGDVVKFDDSYHKLVQREGEPSDSTTRSFNEEPVGLPWENVGDSSAESSGKVFVYKMNSVGSYELIQTITSGSIPLINDLDSGETTINSGDQLGWAVNLDPTGKILLITSPKSDKNFQNQGSAYIFKTDSFTSIEYRLKQKLESYELYPNEYFGQSIAISPDTSKIVVGAKNSPFVSYARFDILRGTTFDQGRTTFVENTGFSGTAYIFELNDDRYFLAEKLEPEFAPNESFAFSLDISNSVIVVGSPGYRLPIPHGVVISYEGPIAGTIRLFEKNSEINSWTTIANQVAAVNLDKIRSIELYDNVNNVKIQDIDYIDSTKFKILNLAEQEIKFKTFYDPAIYSLGTDNQVVDASIAWTESQVGNLWWDISKAKWLHFEQGDIAHRVGNVNQLVEGSSIDVYEWVESVLLPSEWSALADTNEGIAEGISGQPLYPNDDVYSIKVLYSPSTGLPTETKYYYWVKNSVIVPPSVTGRRISASEVADLIENPTGSGEAFIVFADQDKFLTFNIADKMSADTALLNIQFYKNSTQINSVHNEYQLLVEDDPTSVPVLKIESKWIDSLVGYDTSGNRIPDPNLSEKQKYGVLVRPRQSMFKNRLEILKILINRVNSVLLQNHFTDIIDFAKLNSFEEQPSAILNTYDMTVDTDSDLIAVGTTRVKQAVLRANLIDGQLDTVDIIEPGFGYKVVPSVDYEGTGSGAKISLTIDNQGRINSATVISRGKKYSTLNITVRNFSVLVLSDSQTNNGWSVYSWDDRRKSFFKSRTQSYDTRRYWQLIDWWKEGFNSKSRIVKEINNLYEEYSANLIKGDLLRIKEYNSGGWAVFEKINDDNTLIFLERYQLVGREKGTFEFLSSLYNLNSSGIGFDTSKSFDAALYDLDNSLELRNIISSIKHNIFINEYAVEWNRLFFTSLRYIFTEQLYVDWIFKTSFLNATHNVGLLEQKVSYKNDNLESFKKYIEEVKPYRTSVREYVSRYENIDYANSAFSDFDLPASYITELGSIIPVNENNELINQYPWQWWKDNKGFSITEILVSDGGAGYASAPKVLIEGFDDPNFSAQAFVSNGKVSGIKVISSGSNYTETPTVVLVGGGNPTRQAKVVPILGNSLIRTLDLKIKFDRFTKEGRFNNLTNSENYTATGFSGTFDLKFAPSTDKSKITVLQNSQILLSDQYDISLYLYYNGDFTELRGKLSLKTIPPAGDIIELQYEKNIELLDSINRIERFYNPTKEMKGKDFSQLMTGMDFGGVQIQGTTFDVTGGWDALPWFTDNWDSVESSSDYYVVVDGSTTSVTLPFVPAEGQQINIYLKRAGDPILRSVEDLQYSEEVAAPRIIRIDDPNYTSSWDSSISTNPNAQMPTFVGDGSTNTIEIGIYIQTNAGDTLIFRPVESDGSVTINDPNILDTKLSGGTLSTMSGAYATATGLTPEEIVIEGGKFITPDAVPAPEENVPGQVLDNLSIRVFTSNLVGGAPLMSKVIISNGIDKIFSIGQTIIENKSLLVYVDKVQRRLGNDSLDYSINLTNNTLEFVTAPTESQIIEIISIGIGGLNLIDYQEFVADGETNLFLTKANYFDTSIIFVTINGETFDTNFINSSDVIDVKDRTMVQFGVTPAEGSVIKIICMKSSADVDSDGYPVIRINQEDIFYDGSTRSFNLDNFVNLERASALSSIIVEVNSESLRGVDTIFTTYDGTNNQFVLGVDPVEVPGVILPANIKVFVNNDRKTFITDYDYDGNTKTLTISTAILNVGDDIKIENDLRSQYIVNGNGIQILDSVSLVENDKISVIWFSEYPSTGITSDEYIGGKLKYRIPYQPLSIDFVWAYKNGQRLTKDVDFYLSSSNRDLYLKNNSTSDDIIKIVVFGSSIYQAPSAYEISKDMLNFYQFKRFSSTEVSLARELNYYDVDILLNDASQIGDPDLGKNIPGIIYINGEKIEYLSKNGNLLGDLRRGAFGTSIKEVYSIGTPVIDVGRLESIPYNEEQERVDFVSDGSTLLIGPLPFIPVKTNVTNWSHSSIPADFGRSDQLEIFVGGKRLSKNQVNIFDETLGAVSPQADITKEAEFSVDGINPYIRLTSAPDAGVRISIIKRTGKTWYDKGDNTIQSGKTLLENESAIPRFITQKTTRLPE